jgi:hypothetical protein
MKEKSEEEIKYLISNQLSKSEYFLKVTKQKEMILQLQE